MKTNSRKSKRPAEAKTSRTAKRKGDSRAAHGSGLGKFGIKGHSSLGVCGFFHISMNYDSNGKIFVEKPDEDGLPSWERMTLKQARRKSAKIIRCAMCKKPAVSLDHHWPYYNEMNRCERHYGKKYVPNAEAKARGN